MSGRRFRGSSDGSGLKRSFDFVAGQLDDEIGKFADAEFARIAQIYRPGHLVGVAIKRMCASD